MVIGNISEDREVKLIADEATLYHQELLKLPGVTLSANRKFYYHIADGPNNMVSKIHSRTSLVKCIRPYIPMRLLAIIGGVSSTV